MVIRVMLSILVLQALSWQVLDATSCPTSVNTCLNTLFVKGECWPDIYKCKDVSQISVKTGCADKITPIITIETTKPPSGKGSGEIKSPGSVALICKPVLSEATYTYVWTKGASVDNRTSALIIVDDTQADFYKCKIKDCNTGYESAESAQVEIKVVTNPSQPVLTGMKSKLLTTGEVGFDCTNVVASNDYGTITLRKMTPSEEEICGRASCGSEISANTDYACKIENAQGALLVKSENVKSPISTTHDISGVKITEGTRILAPADGIVDLTCEVTDTDLAYSRADITYTWKKGADIITNAKSARYTTPTLTVSDSANYTCTGKYSTKPEKTSAPIEVVVVPLGPSGVVLLPPKPLMGGYATISCNVQLPDPSLLTYSWNKGGILILGQKDQILQINSLAAADEGEYTCIATVGVIYVERSATLTLTSPASMDAPTLTSDKDDDDVFVEGQTYNFSCSSDHYSPGVTFEWLEDDIVITGQSGQTYKQVAKAGTKKYKCKIRFSHNSKESSALPITIKQLTLATLEQDSVVVSSVIKPIVGTMVNLKCVVTKVPGVSGTVTYTWLKDSTAITGQTSSTYSFTADSGDFKCKATLNGDFVESSEVTVTPIYFHPPSVEQPPAVIEYSQGGKYEFTCKTASHNASLQYSWLKDGVAISGATSHVVNQTLNDKGTAKLKCAVTLNDKTESSPEVNITVGDAGRYCTSDSQCEGTGYQQVCVNKRCECAAGYSKTGDKCSGVAMVTASALLMLISAVISRIF